MVATGRKILGQTKPLDSNPGTVRGDDCIDVGRNIIHGSDSVESSSREIALWFKEEELINWNKTSQQWVSEEVAKQLKESDEDKHELEDE